MSIDTNLLYEYNSNTVKQFRSNITILYICINTMTRELQVPVISDSIQINSISTAFWLLFSICLTYVQNLEYDYFEYEYYYYPTCY